ncbi:TonB-dependent receptor [Pedobacter sp. MC2016-24]|uniref:TonB-dependent receptor n=1 Tax=Pedobacter sp. MC2016-24 TaxID=2780090 RepID=UPI0018821BF2|nr:TonB-dependent receptor [Pedobacter sp. MC2016-24]MBE9598367.1 TonB-dependent receptor [Pedobacter sp. MC2016-24]
MRIFLLLLVLTATTGYTAMAQRPLVTEAKISGFYTLSLDKMMDTLNAKCPVHIVYDRDMLSQYDVVDHFNDENLKDLLAAVCKKNGLRYWVDADQTIYIIRIPEDVNRLKKNKAAIGLKDEGRGVHVGQTVNSVKDVVERKTPARQIPFNITGRVIDRSSGESLPSAHVQLRHLNISTSTNADGYFTLINVPADTCRLDINFSGYQQDTYYLNAENIKKEIVIGLFPAVRALNEVVITDKRAEGLMSTNKRRVSVLQISPSKLEELPNIGEKDILRSFQLMPGISASNESSSGAYVRGGTPDQNLVLFDGFTVYQVDHLYGFFSAFNSNAVKDVTMYKGGFSAKYGGRLSSVTDIVGKEGNSKETNIAGDLSLLSANVFVEKPINDKSTLLLAYRRSYQGPLYDKIFNKFNSSSATTAAGGNRPANAGTGGPPGGGGGGFGGNAASVSTPASYFYDLNAKYTYAPDDQNRFSWSIYQGNDNLDNSRTLTLPAAINSGRDISMSDKTTYGNLGSSLKWSSRWNSKLYSNTLLSYSTYHSDRDNSTKLTVQDDDGNDQEISTGTFEKNNLKDFSLKSDWEYQLGGQFKALFGAFGSRQNVSYESSQNDTSKLIDQHTKALILGGYGELEADLTTQLQVKAGLRETWYDQTRKTYLEPRFSATYAVTDKFTLKASTGKFYQFTNRVLREDILSGSRDFWVLSNGDAIPVSAAVHYIGGFSYETGQFLFDVESYYKKLDNLSEYAQRLTGNRRGGTVSLEEHFYNGSGYAKGIELMLQKTRGRYTGWISYTLAEATNNFAAYGGEFAASQDTRHEFKTVNLYHYGKWTFSATWIFATGKPYTAPLTSYTIDDYTGTAKTFLTISDKNALRMPAYHRLDASITYDLIKVDSRKTGSIGFSLFNIYNRANVWYKQYNVVNNQVVTSNVNYLGLTPNLTLSLRWK